MDALKRFTGFSLLGFFLAGCASFTHYSKPDAPWATLRRVAVVPFAIPSENPTRRQLLTKLFAEELRKSAYLEVAEAPLTGPLGGSPPLDELAKAYQADAVFYGSVDDTQGTVVHVWLHDAATKEILWSGTYLLGISSEFFSLRTQQQQYQKSIRRIVKEFLKSRV